MCRGVSLGAARAVQAGTQRWVGDEVGLDAFSSPLAAITTGFRMASFTSFIGCRRPRDGEYVDELELDRLP